MKKDIYMVGVIPKSFREDMELYQKQLAKLYDLYNNDYPELHFTLVKIYYDDKNQIESLVDNLNEQLKSCKPINIKVHGASCFDPPYKSVNLSIETNDELVNLSDIIKKSTKTVGMTYEDSFDEWQYHISIANSAFSDKEWTESEYSQACSLLKDEDPYYTFRIDHLQLWYPVKENYVIHNFYLND